MTESSKRYKAMKWWFGDRFEIVHYGEETRYELEMDLMEVVFVIVLVGVLVAALGGIIG